MFFLVLIDQGFLNTLKYTEWSYKLHSIHTILCIAFLNLTITLENENLQVTFSDCSINRLL